MDKRAQALEVIALRTEGLRNEQEVRNKEYFDVFDFENNGGVSYWFETLVDDPETFKQALAPLRELFPKSAETFDYLEKRHLNPDSVIPADLADRYPLVTERMDSAKAKRTFLRFVDWAKGYHYWADEKGEGQPLTMDTIASVTEAILKNQKKSTGSWRNFEMNPYLKPGKPDVALVLEEFESYTQWQVSDYRETMFEAPKGTSAK